MWLQGLPGSGSSLTSCEICVLLKVGYDEVAEDVEAGEEQGTDLRAEGCGQCRHALRAALLPRLLAPTSGDAASPGACQLHPICFSTPGTGYTPLVHSDLSVQWGLHTGFTHGCHKLAQHPGQGAESPPGSGSACAGKSVNPWDIPEVPDPTALALLAPAPSRATGTALNKAPRTSAVSLPPPLERRGQARAGDVQGTRRPFIPLGTRQDEERSPESSTLAQVQWEAAVAPPFCLTEGVLTLLRVPRMCQWGGREPPELAQFWLPEGQCPAGPSAPTPSSPVKGLRPQVPSCHGLYPTNQRSAWWGEPQLLLYSGKSC